MDVTRIYLVENCFGDPNKMYIGKTKGSREKNHKKTYGSQIFYTYIDEVEGCKKEDWKSLECFWIEQFRQWGFELMNKNKGGGGPSFQTEESNKKRRKPKPDGFGNKISKFRTGKSFEEICGVENAKNIKNKISKSKLGNRYALNNILSQETKNKISESKKNHPCFKTKSFSEKHKKPKPEGFGERLKKSNSKSILQYDLKGNFIKEWESGKLASKELKINPGNISSCCAKIYKSAGGYIWKYKNIK
jgi:hypothetical protein